jgi:hypothetical protein
MEVCASRSAFYAVCAPRVWRCARSRSAFRCLFSYLSFRLRWGSMVADSGFTEAGARHFPGRHQPFRRASLAQDPELVDGHLSWQARRCIAVACFHIVLRFGLDLVSMRPPMPKRILMSSKKVRTDAGNLRFQLGAPAFMRRALPRSALGLQSLSFTFFGLRKPPRLSGMCWSTRVGREPAARQLSLNLRGGAGCGEV